ncbi:hypothetical protein LguiA_028412 [Lonicera macranthoides]
MLNYSRPNFSLRIPLGRCVRKICTVSVVEAVDGPGSSTKDNSGHDSVYFKERVVDGSPKKKPSWKRLSSKDIGITTSMIPRPTRIVLNGLKREGFEVYLVGGCVRDLVLKRTPKDFDIITSAELKEVRSAFSRCRIIGNRFPICHVYIDDTIVEVSSLSTSATKSGRDMNLSFEGHDGFDERDYFLWKNCLQRDFTINGLMFDPYANLVYDYLGGVEDLKNAKVRTLIPANLSLLEDCARILRAVRIAARLGFRFTRETAHNIKNLASSVLGLDKDPHGNELHARIWFRRSFIEIIVEIWTLGITSTNSEASLRLLWKFGLLELLLPIQAAYFACLGFRRRDKRSNMLLCMFSNLDKLLAPDKPCHISLWVAILAFHKALSDEPRDPMVVAAFSLAVHNGGDMLEALNIARRISRPHDTSFHELLVHQNLDSATLKDEVLHLNASVSKALSIMTDEHFVSQAMNLYPKAPYSDLVFIPLGLYLRVCKIFECVKEGKEEQFMAKQGSKINHDMLTSGSLQEVRHVFARVVFDTLYPINLRQDEDLGGV